MKIAISIPDDLFSEVERVAKEKSASRSEVFAAAIRDFLEKHKSQMILDSLNAVYSVAETSDEYKLRKQAKKRHRKIIGREKY